MNILSKFWLRRRQNYVRNLIENSKILDIGCGEFKILPNAIGVDIYPYVGVDKLGSAENLPFKNNSFDTVTMLEVIEHLKNPEKALKEIYRVLKKHGHVIISTPNVTLVWKLIWKFWTKTLGRRWKDLHVNELNEKSFERLFLKHFKILYKDKVNRFILVFKGEKT